MSRGTKQDPGLDAIQKQVLDVLRLATPGKKKQPRLTLVLAIHYRRLHGENEGWFRRWLEHSEEMNERCIFSTIN